jgi:hypothetical protein
MTEETPQVPDQPNPEPTQVPAIPKEKDFRSKPREGILGVLPEPVLKDMERWMMKHSVHSVKEYMKNTYGKEFPQLMNVGKHVYQYYKKAHKQRLEQEQALIAQVSAPPTEALSVINAVTDPNITLEDKRKAFTELFNACEARRKLLELKNSSFIDPYLEKLRNENINLHIKMIEKVTVLNESLTRESSQDYLKEFSDFLSVILVAVYNTAKLTYGESNFSMFHSKLEETLQNSLKNYKAAKARLKESK